MDCDGCVFNRKDENGSQIGCSAGRLEKFIERGNAKHSLGRPFYDLDRFCNMYRDQDIELETARLQVMQTFGIVIEDSLERNSWEDYLALIEEIKKIEYPASHVKIVLSTSRKRGVENVVRAVDDLKQAFRHTSALFHEHDQAMLKEYENFMKLINAAYLVKLDVWKVKTLDKDLFSKIDKITNDEMEPIVILKEDGFYVALKNLVNKFYLDFNDYDKTIDFLYGQAKGVKDAPK